MLLHISDRKLYNYIVGGTRDFFGTKWRLTWHSAFLSPFLYRTVKHRLARGPHVKRITLWIILRQPLCHSRLQNGPIRPQITAINFDMYANRRVKYVMCCVLYVQRALCVKLWRPFAPNQIGETLPFHNLLMDVCVQVCPPSFLYDVISSADAHAKAFPHR
jgi:hypothetical protein